MTLLLAHDDGTIRRKLLDALELARDAAVQDAGEGNVGEHVGAVGEDAVSVTHLFDSTLAGYRGWQWSVTVATADEQAPVTVSEVVLTPGPDAIVAPRWVPWERRVRPGDLGVGDLFPTHADDARLAPTYATLDDPEADQAVPEVGLGRVRVLSRLGREEAATRWQRSEYGPRSDMARSAPASCGTCGFYLQLAGSLRAAFGVCGNELSPADGHVVHAEFGCGAHSEVEVETAPSVPVAQLVYDDSQLDFDPVEPSSGAGVENGTADGVATEGAAESQGWGGRDAEQSRTGAATAENTENVAVEASATEEAGKDRTEAHSQASGASGPDDPAEAGPDQATETEPPAEGATANPAESANRDAAATAESGDAAVAEGIGPSPARETSVPAQADGEPVEDSARPAPDAT